MLDFPLDPQTCLILNAFNKASTLRGAAGLLGMDPPALVRKVQKIAESTGYLQKLGNRWSVTDAGRRVAQWTDETLNSQRLLLDEKPRMRIAAFMWLGEEMLISQFPKLQTIYGKDYSWSLNMTATHLEQELIQGRTDFVIQGHAPTDPAVAYRKISSYPWVVILPSHWKKEVSQVAEKDLFAFLKKKPFVRHSQVNPSEALGTKITDLAPLEVDSVIGVRSCVANGLGWGIVPRMAAQSLLKDGKIFRVSLPVDIEDHVSVWWLRARKDMSRAIAPIYKWVSRFPVL